MGNLKRFEELRYCGNLPSPSGVGLSILQATQREELPLEELVAILEVDPALAGRVLRLANTARAAGSTPASSVAAAGQLLGPAALRSAALGFTLLPAGNVGAGPFDHELFWSHSIASAHAAREMAADIEGVDPHEAFTAGLLARVGLLALATIHAEAYAGVLAATRGSGPEHLLLEEARHFDIQHWEVAAAMLAEWGLPERIVAAILALGASPREPGVDDPEAHALTRCLRDAAIVAARLVSAIPAARRGGAERIELFQPSGRWVVEPARLARASASVAAPWRATCERLRLPSGPCEAPTPGPAVAGAAVVTGSQAADADGSHPTAAGACETEEPAPIARGELRVLVVDDDPDMVRLVAHHLTTAGYGVLTAESGERALEVVHAERPHILVSDWWMPGISGLELVRAVRRAHSGERVYVLILTAAGDEEQVVRAFDAGADDFVGKPLNARILLARVQAGHRMVELQRQVEADDRRRSTQATEMGLLTRKLVVAAQTDVLTELPNRREAMVRLEREWADAVAHDRPLSVLVVDIDRFKRINDQHGHDVGDAVLRSTAAVLRARTRRADLVCRLGGEEFLVINVCSDAYDAAMCAERLRRFVQQNRVRLRELETGVTISVGVATRDPRMTSAQALLKAADEAVYSAKAAGRNLVCAHALRRPESA